VAHTHQAAAPFPIAHRAGNDLELLRTAERLGLPLVEADVHLFRGRLEVRHLKTVGPVPLLWDRWELASPLAPRLLLEELLDAAAPHTELVLDLKGRDARLAARTLDALRRAGRATATVCARAWPLLAPFRDLEGVRTVGSVGRAHRLRSVERRFAAARPDGISIHVRLLDEAVVARLLRLTPLVLAWPVHTLEDASRLAAWGVTGLIVDDLELAAALATEGLQAGRGDADRALA
jgi:glycerophosphoryl diester phosphodiesterase